MDLQRLRISRRGHRSVITKLFTKLEDCQENTFEYTSVYDALRSKQELLSNLNKQIFELTEEEQLENELMDTEEYSLQVEIKLRKYAVMQGNVSSNPTPSIIDTQSVNPPSLSTHGQFSKLPKLSLPNFGGDILKWQSFWESFEASIHTNCSISNVQKFSYLKSLLEGEAARTISGFALTNENYLTAIELLRERFGKTPKIINAHMQALLKIPAPRNDISSLKLFYDQLENYVRGLESLGQSQETYGALLTPVIIEKLPQEIRRNISREHGLHINLGVLRAAIHREIDIIDSSQSTNIAVDMSTETAAFIAGAKSNQRRDKPESIGSSSSHHKYVCAFCDGSHPSTNCQTITDHESRISCVKQKKLCFNCLGKHKVSVCKSKFRCRKCQKKHHTSLCNCVGNSHGNDNQQIIANDASSHSEPTQNQSDISNTGILHSSAIQSRNDVLLKTAVSPVYSSNMRNYSDANILFDEGAQRSFITEELATTINLNRCGTESLSVSAFGNSDKSVRNLDTGIVKIRTTHGKYVSLKVLIVPTISAPLTNFITKDVTCLPHIKGLRLAHPISQKDSFNISLLIGADHYWDIVQNRVVRGKGPTAVQSKIGYLLSGPVSVEKNTLTNQHMMNIITSHTIEDSNLERFWNLESIGINSNELESKETDFLQSYQNDFISFADGRYEAKLPWEDSHKELPSNYAIAQKRVLSTINRLRKEQNLLQKYGEIISDQENRGFIEKVSNEQTGNRIHYIPHHAVKKDSSTTPIRIVYDCSCSQSPQHPSLNDCLKSTPPNLNDLSSLLLRFRLGAYATSTDIEKAFLHVSLHEDDRDVTRFFWLSDPSKPDSALTTYRFKAVLFGATCSPFILNATLLKHLKSHPNEFSQMMERDLYVDNIISSFDNEHECVEYFKTARELMSSAGFNLRSWTSNNDKLREIAKQEKVLDDDDKTKILGMRWDVEKDTLSFQKHDQYSPNSTTTKREVLQQSSKIYDPLGLLNPVSIRAKMFLQKLWKQGNEWDEILSKEDVKEWKCISDDIQAATTTEFDRHYFETSGHHMQNSTLHIFVDASTKAYGAVAYLCHDKHTTIIMAKSRVAPIKKLTLPQLELMAAVIGSRLANHIQDSIKTSNIVFWSDSQIVLHWIASTKTLGRFIENRVKEIREKSNPNTWRYCPTDSNPADILTRGIQASQFLERRLWWNGPDWLTDSAKWPVWNSCSGDQAILHQSTELFTETSVLTTEVENDTAGIHNVIDITRFGSLQKLLRVTALVRRFIHNTSQKNCDKVAGQLTSEELQNAEDIWIRHCQQQEFKDVKSNLQQNITKGTPIIKQLRLYLSNKDIIRCGGRIHNAPLEDSAKFPILLPSHHQFTDFIILNAHQKQLHCGANITVTYIRQKFWIPAIRQRVNKVLRKCVTCNKVIGKPYCSPDPPPLPEIRLRNSNPFTVTGVDFTGALSVRNADGVNSKAYICLFTCASTRAIHLEVTSSLSVEAFLNAFRRFTSRCSIPKIMVSDNASTFIAASEILQTSLKNAILKEGTEWRFIPKRAPWFGGWWERMIGLTKVCLKKVLGKSLIAMETLQTYVTEIEAVLNDRPLTFVSSNFNDGEPLTPSHLLYGRRITSTCTSFDSCYTDIDVLDPDYGNYNDLLYRSEVQTNTMNSFRKRWTKEYLTSLREFHKVSGNNNQKVKVGDIVLVQDDIPRVRWKLAKIEELLYGGDGLIRSANIRTANGFTNRPITKLVPLEVTHRDSHAENNITLPSGSTFPNRPLRQAAKKANINIRKWTNAIQNDDDDDAIIQ